MTVDDLLKLSLLHQRMSCNNVLFSQATTCASASQGISQSILNLNYHLVVNVNYRGVNIVEPFFLHYLHFLCVSTGVGVCMRAYAFVCVC